MNFQTMRIRVCCFVIATILFFVGCSSKQRIIVKPENWDGYKHLRSIADKYIPLMDIKNEWQYKIFVIESESTTSWVAESMEDYYSLFFTTQMLSLLNEKELSFILCHEVAHRVKGHYEKKLLLSGGISTGLFLGGLLLPGVGAVDNIANPELVSRLSNEQEIEADKLAIREVMRFGVTKEQCVSAIKKLYSTDANESIFVHSTDPLVNERIDKILNFDDGYSSDYLKEAKAEKSKEIIP